MHMISVFVKIKNKNTRVNVVIDFLSGYLSFNRLFKHLALQI